MTVDDLVLGVDIGGTKTAAGLVAADGRVVARASAATPAALGPEAVVETVVRLAVEVLAHSGAAAVLGCGVGAAGVIGPGSGRVVSATSSLPGWAGTDLTRVLGSRLRMPVVSINDVHAHAAGESRFGGGRGRATVLVLAAGTGVGGALVVDGRVQTGSRGVSGHFGHLPSEEARDLPCPCGRRGHLEGVASGPAIRSAYLAGGGDPVADTQAVFAAADAGDELAAAVIDTAGRALGRTLGGLVNALDPDVVVVGGGLSEAGDHWWSSLRQGFAREAMPVVAGCSLERAVLGADAAIIGAAEVFRRARPGTDDVAPGPLPGSEPGDLAGSGERRRA